MTWILRTVALAMLILAFLPRGGGSAARTVVISIEGARLESLYGDAFRRYAVAVPGLIPRLHAYVPLAADRSPQTTWSTVRFSDNHEVGIAFAVGLGVIALFARWAVS